MSPGWGNNLFPNCWEASWYTWSYGLHGDGPTPTRHSFPASPDHFYLPASVFLLSHALPPNLVHPPIPSDQNLEAHPKILQLPCLSYVRLVPPFPDVLLYCILLISTHILVICRSGPLCVSNAGIHSFIPSQASVKRLDHRLALRTAPCAHKEDLSNGMTEQLGKGYWRERMVFAFMPSKCSLSKEESHRGTKWYYSSMAGLY